ncbi:hypothetical protein AAG570_004135 [Ranatra chinensis]|uniref:Tubulin-specific chaperone A n=1 Tax=Ranatra chinensis TaxID=642074 RepID=A0ABD0Y566_9HEMI
MSDPRLRTLKIKTGVVKRLAKEKFTYEKEVKTEEARLQRFKDEGKDESDIKKQEEVLQETVCMVPDCQRRLQKAYEELQSILDTEQDLKEQEDYLNAVKVMEEAKNSLAN